MDGITQPGRILVIDHRNNLSIPYLIALGFIREKTGRRAGMLSYTFPPGEIAKVVALSSKSSLEEAGVQCHTEFTGKVFKECTMYCLSYHHPRHTSKCINRRKGK
jgi:hypothetical protein